jgi:hypothetical protein
LKPVLVGHDATSIFLYLHQLVKGSRTRGGRMIASEFDDRSPSQVESRPNDRTFQAGCLGCSGGLSARIVSRGYLQLLT